jgi:TIR domain
VVYQKGRFLTPVHTIQVQIPLDVPLGHHSFKVGVDYRFWDGQQWAEQQQVEWGFPAGPSLDQVLINYPPPRTFKVFISHSGADQDLVESVSDYVRRSGQVPYIAESPNNPDLGKSLWEEKIETALQSSNVILVLWTENSAPSQSVKYEIARATALGKRVIPAVSSRVETPEILRRLVYVRFDESNRIEAIKSILKSLLDYESEANRQHAAGVLAFLGLLAAVGIAGAALNSRT